MSNNGTDRDIAIQIVGLVNDISAQIDEFNKNQYGPVIVTQPTDTEVAIGDTARFTVTAYLATSYQWQVKTQTTDWTNSTSPGARQSTVRIEASEQRYDYFYRCIVTGAQSARVITDEVKMLRPTT